ncbi:hypothetical protein [Legionella brunensis]|uniref:Uncharacterized protein n=1 Tax=Legionella brunensis TaxID=29422 RepID=A0A0W0S346_9GAMM|nr:hypothetical protein [Legionella brunensis]KTC77894.1 hypothetical protein Lbru_2787 [Legionella brunensis]
MIYFLYLLLLVLTLAIAHRIIVRILGGAQQKGLQHDNLLSLFDEFEYAHDDGVCFGFTLTWAQDAALEADESFYQRLNLIKQEKHRIVKKVQHVNHKIKNKETINQQEDQLLEIKSFIESICLAQSPEVYSAVYAQRLTQSHINTILSLIRRKLATNTTVKCFFAKTMAFHSKKEISNYFRQLSQLLKTSDKIAMVLSCESCSRA